MPNTYWLKANNNLILIKAMEDDHLENTINRIKRSRWRTDQLPRLEMEWIAREKRKNGPMRRMPTYGEMVTSATPVHNNEKMLIERFQIGSSVVLHWQSALGDYTYINFLHMGVRQVSDAYQHEAGHIEFERIKVELLLQVTAGQERPVSLRLFPE